MIHWHIIELEFSDRMKRAHCVVTAKIGKQRKFSIESPHTKLYNNLALHPPLAAKKNYSHRLVFFFNSLQPGAVEIHKHKHVQSDRVSYYEAALKRKIIKPEKDE